MKPWRLLGVAGLAGVAATGVILARDQRKRAQPPRRRRSGRVCAAGGGQTTATPRPLRTLRSAAVSRSCRRLRRDRHVAGGADGGLLAARRSLRRRAWICSKRGETAARPPLAGMVAPPSGSTRGAPGRRASRGDRVLDRGGPGQRERLVPDADDAVGLVHHELAGAGSLRAWFSCATRQRIRPHGTAAADPGGLLDLGTELGVLDEALVGPGDASRGPVHLGPRLLGQLLRQRLDLNGLRVCFCFLGRGVDVNVDLVRRAPALSDVSHAYPFRPRPSARGRAAWVPVLFRVGLQGSFPRIGTRGPPQPWPSTAGAGSLAFGARPGDPAVLSWEEPGAPMEHTTEFLGHIDITPALNEDEIGYLTAKVSPRRFRWAPCWTGCCLTFDGSERRPVAAWLRYVIAHLLKPGARRVARPGPVRELRSTTGWTDGRRLPRDTKEPDRDAVRANRVSTRTLRAPDPRHAGWPTSAHEQPTDLERAERKRRRREARTSNVIDLSSVFPGPAWRVGRGLA